MAKIYGSALELIGNTPLVEVKNIEKAENLEARVLVKLEYFNPAGSVKDRIAKSMIEDAEEKRSPQRRFHRLLSRPPEIPESGLCIVSQRPRDTVSF